MRSLHLKTCTLALAAALSMPAFSQGSSTNSPSATTAAADTTTTRRDSDRGFDWGWLGLLGLVGLIGLRRHPDVRQGDTMRSTTAVR